MVEDRRTKQDVTPGEDPREIDKEKLSEQALEEMEGQQGIVHPQPRKADMGVSSDRPGRDVDELSEEHEPRRLRHQA